MGRDSTVAASSWESSLVFYITRRYTPEICRRMVVSAELGIAVEVPIEVAARVLPFVFPFEQPA